MMMVMMMMATTTTRTTAMVGQQGEEEDSAPARNVKSSRSSNGNGNGNAVAAPPWLKPLLDAEFFGLCRLHAEIHQSASSASAQQQTSSLQSNHFCLDCPSAGPLCPSCVASSHAHHHVVQIRRSSYHDVIRVSEIQKVLNLGGIQSYVINSARVVFINGRPQLRHGKGVTNTCQVCDRSLVDTFRFCSLGCKLAGLIKEHQQSPRGHSDLSFLILGDHQHHQVPTLSSTSCTTSSSSSSAMKQQPVLYHHHQQQQQQHHDQNNANNQEDADSKSAGVPPASTSWNNNHDHHHHQIHQIHHHHHQLHHHGGSGISNSCHYSSITTEEEIKFMDDYKAKLSRLKLVKQNLSSSSSASSSSSSSSSAPCINAAIGPNNRNQPSAPGTASESASYAGNKINPSTGITDRTILPPPNAMAAPATMMISASNHHMYCDPHTPSPTNNNNRNNRRLLQTLRRSPSRRKGTPQRSPMMAI